jgi:hypothetical protein
MKIFTEKDKVELIKFLIPEISDNGIENMLCNPSFPNIIGKFHKVFTQKEIKDTISNNEYMTSWDVPSTKYYDDSMIDEPYNCKEFRGHRYVYFNDMGTSGNKFY